MHADVVDDERDQFIFRTFAYERDANARLILYLYDKAAQRASNPMQIVSDERLDITTNGYWKQTIGKRRRRRELKILTNVQHKERRFACRF